MRADRLLSLVLLLQARGKLTAEQLSKELEVSQRTIYRDIDALSIAGIPVYGAPGPDGGYALLDGYRTRLTGLTEGEVRALFMLSIPRALNDLGISHELSSALLKLSAAIPSVQRREEERVRRRFHLDSDGWHQSHDAVPHLSTVHIAVVEDRMLEIEYGLPFAIKARHVVEPYGLVAKAGVWHMVCAELGPVRVHRVCSLLDAALLDANFERPHDFDLSAFWEAWCAEREKRQISYTVTARVAPKFIPVLPKFFGGAIRSEIARAGPPDVDGWITMTLTFESLEAARDRILGFGRGMEVLEPVELRLSVLDYAAQIVGLYIGATSTTSLTGF